MTRVSHHGGGDRTRCTHSTQTTTSLKHETCFVIILPKGSLDPPHRNVWIALFKARANDPPHENVWIAQRKYHRFPKGALTTARPSLVNARLTGETCAKNFADTCYTASGPRAGTNATEPLKKPHCITRGLKQSCGTGLATRQNGPAGQDLLHDWNGSVFDKA